MGELKVSEAYWGFIKDPLYDYIRITETEKKIIDTGPVQRLRRIRQLSGAEYVYPAANHTRFEHVLGVMHLAGVLASNLPAELSHEEIQKVKVAALLHDIGHAPYSHLFEPLLEKVLGKAHEDMTSWIIRDSELGDALDGCGFGRKEVSELAVGKLRDPKRRFLDQIISSTVDVDKMDYVVRDSYHTGAGYGQVDVFRLVYTMDILDGDLAVDASALPTLEAFLLARLESFRAIYFHKVSRAVQIMLLKALEAAQDDLGISEIGCPDDYLRLDDYVVWGMLKGNERSRLIVEDVERRRLLKCVFEETFFTRDELMSSVFTNEEVRRKVEEEIGKRAEVDAGNVIIDVPSLSSVPYHYSLPEPVDLPIFQRLSGGGKVARKVTDLSKVLDALKAFMNIVRVYTREPYREEVARAAESVLGKASLREHVSRGTR